MNSARRCRPPSATWGKTFSQEAEKALDHRAREELERLTTDTARAVAKFLYDRDQDILQAARIAQGPDIYRKFLDGRSRLVVDPGPWKLSDDGKGWVPASPAPAAGETVTSSNPENRQDFHYRLPETVQANNLRPLYHEITFVGLDGQEKYKVAATSLLPPHPARRLEAGKHLLSRGKLFRRTAETQARRNLRL